jgi:hypothetical protein
MSALDDYLAQIAEEQRRREGLPEDVYGAQGTAQPIPTDTRAPVIVARNWVHPRRSRGSAQPPVNTEPFGPPPPPIGPPAPPPTAGAATRALNPDFTIPRESGGELAARLEADPNSVAQDRYLQEQRAREIKRKTDEGIAEENREVTNALLTRGVSPRQIQQIQKEHPPVDRAAIQKTVEETGLTPEEKRMHDEGTYGPGMMTREDVGGTAAPKSEEPIGPPAPPVYSKRGEKGEGKGKPGAAGAAGKGGSASASAAASMKLPTEIEGGPDFERPYLTAAGAEGAIAEANQEKVQAEAEAAKQRQLATDKAQADLQHLQKDYDQIQQKHFARLEQLNNEVAEGKIDPERWWHSQSTGKQVLYILGAMLGGYAVGLRGGGQNATLDMVRKHIDDDIEAQRAGLEGKKAAARGEESLLNEAYRRTHNMQEAVLLARSAAYESVENQLTQMTAGANSSIAAANGNLAIAGWQKWQTEWQAKLMEHQQEMALKYAALRARAARGSGNNMLKALHAYSQLLDRRNIPGMESALEQAESVLADKDPAGIGRVKAWFADHWPMLSGMFMTETGLENRNKLHALAGEVGKGLGGRLTATSLQFEKSMIENGTPEQARAAIQSIRQKVNRVKANAALGLGLDPAMVEAYDAMSADMAGDGGGGAEDITGMEP